MSETKELALSDYMRGQVDAHKKIADLIERHADMAPKDLANALRIAAIDMELGIAPQNVRLMVRG